MIPSVVSESEEKVMALASTGKKNNGGKRPVKTKRSEAEPVVAAPTAVQPQEAPLGLRARNVFVNLGKAIGAVVNWYAHLTEIGSKDLVEHYRKEGAAAFRKGRFEEAVENFSKLLRLEPTDAEACYMLGLAFGRSGDSPETIRWLRKAVSLNPGDADAHFQLGLALCQKDQLSKAETEFSKVVALLPDEPKGHYRLGVVHDKRRDYDKAVDSLERALALRPQSPKVHQRLGFVYEEKGDHAQALKCFKKAAELEDSAM